jgi:tetratricopeptide (TPR) repeat protein
MAEAVQEEPTTAAGLIARARAAQLEGNLRSASEDYAAAVDLGRVDDLPAMVEALRRLAVIHHLLSEPKAARDYAEESLRLAHGCANPDLIAEALNVLAGFAAEAGDIDLAARHYRAALDTPGIGPTIAPRVEQNLGMIATMRGDLIGADIHYGRALAEYRRLGDERGAAMTLHNLGMVAIDRGLWEEALHQLAQAHEMAIATGDLHLQALCSLNQAQAQLCQRQFDATLRDVERALDLFERLGNRADKADAYRILGVVARETGQLTLAESRLRSAMETAAGAGSPLGEAEATLELARLYHQLDRVHRARFLAGRARRLFEEVGALADAAEAESFQQLLSAR